MIEPAKPDPAVASKAEDKTGRDRLARNVVISWLSQLVFVVFGFVLPRLISDSLGQVSLGIWDFGWSVVGYLNLAMLGIGSAVNRFVAMYRANDDIDALNGTVSSVFVIQLATAILIGMVIAVLYIGIPAWFGDRLGESIDDAKYVILLLGLSVVIKIALDSYRGVITGCHRWDIHNLINAAQYLVSSIVMILALQHGFGLRGLAQAYLLVLAIFEIYAIYVAHRICPEFQVSLKSANVLDIRRIAVFGINKFVIGIGHMLMVQTVSVIVIAKLGPAALAVLMRPIALLRQIQAFVNKFSHVMTPTISSLQALKRTTELQTYTIDMAKIGWALGVPPIIFTIVFGDDVIRLWMGENYVASDVIRLLSISAGLAVIFAPSFSVLVGMDRHSGLAKICVGTWVTLIAVAIAWANLTNWTLTEAAAMLAFSQALIQFVIVPGYLARVLEMSWFTYMRRAGGRVFLVSLAVALSLWLFRELVDAPEIPRMMLGLLLQFAITAPLYWMFVLPESANRKIRGMLPRWLKAS